MNNRLHKKEKAKKRCEGHFADVAIRYAGTVIHLKVSITASKFISCHCGYIVMILSSTLEKQTSSKRHPLISFRYQLHKSSFNARFTRFPTRAFWQDRHQ